MPRRKRKLKRRDIEPDIKYNSVLAAKFINNLMWEGKKTVAQKIFYEALEIIEKKTGEDGFVVFERAINNAKPMIEVRPRRVGGATYQVPVEINPNRRTSLAVKWIIKYARMRNEYRMAEKLAGELIDAARNQGSSIKRKEEVHKMAEANRAFAHFGW